MSKIVLFLTIQLTHWQDSIRCYHSRAEWTQERWQWRSTRHSPKLQHYWNLRLFSVISTTLIGGGRVLPLFRGADGVFYSPSWLNNPVSMTDSYTYGILTWKWLRYLQHKINFIFRLVVWHAWRWITTYVARFLRKVVHTGHRA